MEDGILMDWNKFSGNPYQDGTGGHWHLKDSIVIVCRIAKACIHFSKEFIRFSILNTMMQ